MANDVKDTVQKWIMTTAGAWFNKYSVKTLPAEHSWKLGDDNGYSPNEKPTAVKEEATDEG